MQLTTEERATLQAAADMLARLATKHGETRDGFAAGSVVPSLRSLLAEGGWPND